MSRTPPRKRPRQAPKGRRRPVLRALSIVLCALLLAGVVDIARYAVWPDVASLTRENPGKTSFMEYREAQRASTGKSPKIQRIWMDLSRISPHLILAVTIAEDDKFWKHDGFDLQAIEEAMEKNLEKGEIRAGGSTITQQLAKNLFLTPDKTPVRKLKEAILTWRLERELTKRRILELYLNVAEWGDGIFGIEAASRRYFHKPASDLSPAEAVRLAVVLPNPLKWSPVGDSRFVTNRSRIILSRMKRRGVKPATG